jgi:hypothetical protein
MMVSATKMFTDELDAGRIGVSKFATSTARAGKLFPPSVDSYSNLILDCSRKSQLARRSTPTA